MRWDAHQLARDVIITSEEKGRPADEVLREMFKARRKKPTETEPSNTGRAPTSGTRARPRPEEGAPDRPRSGGDPRAPRYGTGSDEPMPSAEVSRAVFTYYRWRGWTRLQDSLAVRMRHTVDLAQKFKSKPTEFSDEELIEKAFPAWIKEELEVTGDLVRAMQYEPKLWLRARRGQGASVVRAVGYCRPLGEGPLADVLEYLGRQDIFKTKAFYSGLIQIQDASSQAVGLICNPAPGQMWWDACAGEGGKTLHLSDLMDNKGLIWASDRAEWRLRRLRERAARSKVFNYRVVSWDGGAKLPTKTKFDGVLVDAPCTGVGTWNRNPHARWTTTLTDVRELAELQLKLLSNACLAVKPGGRLVYSVCTLTRSETTGVALAFQKSHPEFKRLSLPSPLDPSGPPRETHLLLPQDHGGNGMFVATWIRNAETSSA